MLQEAKNFDGVFSRVKMEIPVVDFNVYELGRTNVSADKLDHLSKEVQRAFTDVGFVYLKNTGISQEEVCEDFLRYSYEKF